MKTTAFILGTWLVLGILPASPQDKPDKDRQYREIVSLIEEGNYEFRVQSVQPAAGRTIRPTTIYTMTKRDGSYQADLPYFGRAYQPSYGGDGGIRFDGEPENQKFTRNEKKRKITVEFKIQGDNDHYEVTLEAGSGGYGTLYISSSRRQSISYYGTIEPLPGRTE
jgi:hypothetical protein